MSHDTSGTGQVHRDVPPLEQTAGQLATVATLALIAAWLITTSQSGPWGAVFVVFAPFPFLAFKLYQRAADRAHRDRALALQTEQDAYERATGNTVDWSRAQSGGITGEAIQGGTLHPKPPTA